MQLTALWRGGVPQAQTDLSTRPVALGDVTKTYNFRMRGGTVELSEPGSAGIGSLVL